MLDSPNRTMKIHETATKVRLKHIMAFVTIMHAISVPDPWTRAPIENAANPYLLCRRRHGHPRFVPRIENLRLRVKWQINSAAASVPVFKITRQREINIVPGTLIATRCSVCNCSYGCDRRRSADISFATGLVRCSILSPIQTIIFSYGNEPWKAIARPIDEATRNYAVD